MCVLFRKLEHTDLKKKSYVVTKTDILVESFLAFKYVYILCTFAS